MRTSVSLNDELTSYVDEVASSAGENNAEAIRETIRHAKEQDDRIEALEDENKRLNDRVTELETELERVKKEKRLILEDRDEKQELVRYVEDERTFEQKWRKAGLTTRLKWKLFGMDSDDE
jgi:metal-responsive CopG/Arc/MetJ family transcriptional regulator